MASPVLRPEDIRKRHDAEADKKRQADLETLLGEPEKKEAAEVRSLVPVKSSSTAVAMQTDDPTQDYLSEHAAGSIPGTLIRFNGKDGKYVHLDGSDLELGETDTFIFLSDQVWIGWIKFDREGHNPPARIQGLLSDGFHMPPRESLGDTNEALWPTGLSGRPEDPWRHQVIILLQHCSSGEMFAFLATNPTSRGACHDLMNHCKRRERISRSDFPLVRLRAGGYERRDPPKVWVHKPVFAVVGHQAKSEVVSATAGNLADDLNDEVPL
jgi:hypothetical protein